MHYLIMDLETAPNPDVKWEPPKDKPDAFMPPVCHRIVCNAGLEIEISKNYNRCNWIGTFGRPGDERSYVEDFVEKAQDDKKQPVIITFNGRGFDIPVLFHRCMHYGIQFPFMFTKDFEYRYGWGDHFDIADKISGHGAAPRVKLDYLAQSIGLPGKLEIDGSKVFELAEKGEYDTINAYGQCDVIETAYIFIRLLFVAGKLNLVNHNNLMYSIRSKAQAKKEPMIKKLIGAIDFEKLEIGYKNNDDGSQTGLFEDEENDPDIPF